MYCWNTVVHERIPSKGIFVDLSLKKPQQSRTFNDCSAKISSETPVSFTNAKVITRKQANDNRSLFVVPFRNIRENRPCHRVLKEHLQIDLSVVQLITFSVSRGFYGFGGYHW